jgi:hypothetical protein
MSERSATQPGLVFYEKSHRYKLDGKWCPGVTTLIKGGLPNSALMYWSARCVAEYVADNRPVIGGMYSMGRAPMVAALKEIPWQRRDDAGVRGTDVHDLAEKLVRGEEVEVPEHLSGHVDSCVRFLDEWKPTALVAERPLANRTDWWAGKPDMFATLPDGRTVLFDYKTSASGIWPETAFQLAAYSHAEFYVDEDGAERPIPKADLCAAVWITEDEYQVVPLKADDDVYSEFLHLKAVADAAKRAKGSKTTLGYVGLPLPVPGMEGAA